VTGYAEDGTIEAIEYGDKIVGVQFHPEVDEKLLSLFSFLFK
jgi:gamma-glutamyl-gamma-aminobutyrate hydrolase PuuD